MLNFLCEANNVGWTIALGVLIALMVVYLILGTINRTSVKNVVGT